MTHSASISETPQVIPQSLTEATPSNTYCVQCLHDLVRVHHIKPLVELLEAIYLALRHVKILPLYLRALTDISLETQMNDRISGIFYGVSYCNLSLRQKQNLERFAGHSLYSMQKKADAVLSEILLGEGENGNRDVIKTNLSRDAFTSEFDFLCHLFDFRTASLTANISFHIAYLNYQNALRELRQTRQSSGTLELGFKYSPLSPPEIGNFLNLHTIRLHSNKLTSLPPEILRCSKLRFLELYHNNLSSFPPEILELPNLQLLFLSGNQLTSIPAAISKLTKLRTLTLKNNRLTSLPSSIGTLTTLGWLVIMENPLTSLPAEILSLDSTIDLAIYIESYKDSQQFQKARLYYEKHQRIPLTKAEFDTVNAFTPSQSIDNQPNSEIAH